MKKGVLPLYTLLILVWLACLQADTNLSFYGLSLSDSVVSDMKHEAHCYIKGGNTILVMPPAFSKINGYAISESKQNEALAATHSNIHRTITGMRQTNSINTIVCINW